MWFVDAYTIVNFYIIYSVPSDEDITSSKDSAEEKPEADLPDTTEEKSEETNSASDDELSEGGEEHTELWYVEQLNFVQILDTCTTPTRISLVSLMSKSSSHNLQRFLSVFFWRSDIRT